MVATNNALKVEIKIGTDGLVQGLKVGTDGVAGAAQEMRASLKDIGAGAQEAHSPFSRFSDLLKEYRQDQRTEGRYAKFFAADIASIGLASKGASMEVTSLVSAFAFGGGLGLAIELTKTLVKAIVEGQSEMANFGKAAGDAVDKVREKVDAWIASMQGLSEAEKIYRSDIMPLHRQEADLKQEILKAQDKLNKALQDEETAKRNRTAGNRTEVLQAQQDLKEAQEKLVIVQASIKRAKESLEPGKAVEKGKKEQEEANKQEKIDEAHEQKMLQLKAQALSGEEKLTAEYAVKLDAINKNHDLSDLQRQQEVAAESQVYIKQVMDFRNEAEAKAAKEHEKWLMLNIKAEHDAADAIEKFFKQKQEEQLKDYERRAKFLETKMKEQMRLGEQLGQSIGSSLAGIALGTESVSKAFSDMGKEIVKLIFDQVRKAIEAYALQAAAAAAAANAGIPGIGVFVAMAAAAAMEAAVMALLDQMPSAAGGYDIPKGLNPMTQLHSGEMVLPEKYANVIRNVGAGEMKPSGDHFSVTALDSRSFEQFLLQPGNRTAVVRVLKQLARDRRV